MERHLRDERYDHLALTQDLTEWFFRGVVGPAGGRSGLWVSDRVLQWLSSVDPLFVDGTFHVRPHWPKCSQLLTIVTMREGQVSSKTQCTEKGFFKNSCRGRF